MYIDTHAHLDDEPFAQILDEVLQRARAVGVEAIVAVGTTAASSGECVELAGRYRDVFAAVGLQPNYCGQCDPQDWDQIVRLSQHERVKALGETGLDAYWKHTPFSLQQDYFDRHLRLAQQTGLPFIVHMRDCETEVLAMLQEAALRGPLRGVLHSFTGSAETARQCLELGLYISFAGMVTYKNAAGLRAVACGIPDDRLLIETDCPYLAPHPRRGQRPNEPSLIVHTAACLAEARGVDVTRLARQTTENARRLFGL